jgi:hypothetical protein
MHDWSLKHVSSGALLRDLEAPENADRVLAAVTHKTRDQIKVVVAALAPRPDLEEKVTPMPSASAGQVEPVPGGKSAQVVANMDAPLAPAQVTAGPVPGFEAQNGEQVAIVPVVQTASPSRVTPLAPGRYGVQRVGQRGARGGDLSASPVNSTPPRGRALRIVSIRAPRSRAPLRSR